MHDFKKTTPVQVEILQGDGRNHYLTWTQYSGDVAALGLNIKK